MRTCLGIVVAIAIAGCATSTVTPDRRTSPSAADIAWEARRPLQWRDFRGPVDPDAAAIQVAMTATTLRWRYEYQLERSSASCRYWIATVAADAVFNPGDSWVKPGQATPAVLEHEQGHFDLTQVFKRRLDARTDALIRAPVACQGDTLAGAQAYAERAAAQAIQREFDTVWQEYTAAQAQYDAGTEHGSIREAQSRWSASIAQALRSGDWRAPP